MAREAKSLGTLRKQLNTLFPNRSKASDGGEGDAAHRARKSDHNPNANGVFTARDFTHDPANGLDCNKLAKVLFDSKDARIKYLIWNRKITKPGLTGWKPYTGANAHNKHLHISVASDARLYDAAAEWNLDGLKVSAANLSNSLTKPNSENQTTSQPPENIALASYSGASATEALSTNPTEGQAAQTQPSPETTQTAEQITNINTGNALPPDFKPETKVVEAPAKENSTATATKMTIAGFAVPTFLVVIIQTIKDLVSQGFINAQDLGNTLLLFVKENTRYFLYLIGLIILGLMLKKLWKQITLWIQMYFAGRADTNDVEVKPQ